jgi:outer membrane protein
MSKFAKSIILAGLIISVPLCAFGAELKVGVVDTMDVMAKSAEGKRVQDSIKRKSEELGKPFAVKRQEIQKQMEDFQKQSAMMKEDARKRKAEELEKKMSDFEKQTNDAQKQLAQYQEKEMTPLLKKMEVAINSVADENKLDLVFDSRAVTVLRNKSLDITDKVRSKFGR